MTSSVKMISQVRGLQGALASPLPISGDPDALRSDVSMQQALPRILPEPLPTQLIWASSPVDGRSIPYFELFPEVFHDSYFLDDMWNRWSDYGKESIEDALAFLRAQGSLPPLSFDFLGKLPTFFLKRLTGFYCGELILAKMFHLIFYQDSEV